MENRKELPLVSDGSILPGRAPDHASEENPSALGGSPAAARGFGKRLIWIGLAMLFALGLAAVAAVLLLRVSTLPSSEVSVDGVSALLSPDAPITVSVLNLTTTVAEVTLYESKLGIDGEIVFEQVVPVKLVPATDGAGLTLWSHLHLQHTGGSGPLDYDSLYRLRLAIKVKELAFPLPRDVLVTREYKFSTLTTPRIYLPNGLVELNYREPVQLRWNAPVERFAVETVPPVDVRTWIDPVHHDVGYVDLNGAKPGARYQIRVTEARGVNGAPLLSPADVTVETPAAPDPITDSLRLKNGNQVVLQWNRPLKSFDYEIIPAAGSVAEIDPIDPRATRILLQGYEQQQEYRIRITRGAGTSGAPLATVHEFTVVTPPPLEVAGFSPYDGAYGVQLGATIAIAFSEEIQDRAAAEAAITVEPSIPGHFEWPERNLVRFVPRNRLPDTADITVRVQAGPEGVRGVSGGYLEMPLEFSFLTQPDKLIEVDLTRQQMTLFEGDKSVFTASVSTGVRGAETPTGLFMVDYKMVSTRMRGVNPSGSRYDIPNVPWVLSFLGDYTIHGAPWRSRFGFPQSNGCVSLETGVARFVYDWSPVGTPVRIHY